MAKPLRFGCVARHPAGSRREWRERVRSIDRYGYDVLLLPDHVGLWPPFAPLVAAAEASDRLRFGTQVLNLEFWNPLLLAREVAAVDVLTDGRLELGLGAGHAEAEFRAAGLRYPRAGERVDHLAEAVPLLRRLLAGDEVSAEGHFALDGAATGLTTAQERIPIMIGGNGDRVLDQAGRYADIVGLVGFTSGTGQRAENLSHFDWRGLANRVSHVRASAGDRARSLELSVLVQAVVVTDDRAGTAQELARPFGQTAEQLLDSPFVMIGSVPSLAGHLRRLHDEHGIGYVTVFEAHAGPLATVIRRLR